MNIECHANCRAKAKILGLPGENDALLLVIKQTVINEQGVFRPKKDEAQLEVFTSECKWEGFDCATDMVYTKENVDLVLLGDVVTYKEIPSKEVTVDISWGEYYQKLRIFGDRYWNKCNTSIESDSVRDRVETRLDDLIRHENTFETDELVKLFSGEKMISNSAEDDETDLSSNDDYSALKEMYCFEMTEPKSFSRLPLTWKNAYGGTGDYGNTFTKNPDGKGFIVPPTKEEECPSADGLPLPNIEDPENLIKNWTDSPDPAGCSFYPSLWQMRLSAGIIIHGCSSEGPPTISNRYFNQAHPQCEIKKFQDGSVFRVTNMRADRKEYSGIIYQPGLQVLIRSPNQPEKEIQINWDLVCMRPERGDGYIVGRKIIPYNTKSMKDSTILITGV